MFLKFEYASFEDHVVVYYQMHSKISIRMRTTTEGTIRAAEYFVFDGCFCLLKFRTNCLATKFRKLGISNAFTFYVLKKSSTG